MLEIGRCLLIWVATVGANRIRPVFYLQYLSSIGAINPANGFSLFMQNRLLCR